MLALSTAWTSGLSRGGAEVFEPIWPLFAALPLGGLVLDAGVSTEALAVARPVLSRREHPIIALRGAVGRPAPSGKAEAPASLRERATQKVPGTPDVVVDRMNPAPRLCAPDPDEREVAIRMHAHALTLASDLEASRLTISLGSIDPSCAPGIGGGIFPANALTEDEAAVISRAVRTSASHRRRCVDGARFALDALCARAEKLGVRVLLETAPTPLELPTPEELDALLAERAGAPLGYAHDAAAARLNHSLGGASGREVLDAGRRAWSILYLSDASGRAAGLPPGRGDVDFAGLLRAAGDIPRVVAPQRFWSATDLEEGVRHMLAKC
jgi:sugar phosphate isomerase/epimerase